MDIPFYTPDQISLLPNQPGIYKFYNANRVMIYVGKAKDLKKRVSSYFHRSRPHDRKTARMVTEIRSIEFTIVNSEFDAFLLENNLIKQNQPRYNIRLKDDKSFPYILITNERFPRVMAVRNVTSADGTIFGPYTRVKSLKSVLDLIKNLYTIRTCNYSLTEDNVINKKFKSCLEYHIGNCKAPCENLQTEEDYNQDIEQIIHILKGNFGIVKNYFREKMQGCAAQLEFEKAHVFKEKLEYVEKFQTKSLVVNAKIAEVDVFTIVSDEEKAYINYLKIINGIINLTKTVEVKKRLEETDEELLLLLIVELRQRYGSRSVEILTNIPISAEIENIEFVVPKIGDKKKLIELSLKNAIFYKREVIRNQNAETEPKENRVLKKLQADLQLKILPQRIECFDNSNMQGSNPVASMVCFVDGKPCKKEYRHFNIRTVEGPNDFASMHEIVSRRYKRALEENTALPDLIVIDGGKGQLSAATDALKELGVYGKIPIIGIAKRLEEIYYPEDSWPLHIEKKSESLKLLQHVRNEAHRFAITFHRDKRSKAGIRTTLEDIKGVGEKTTDKLLRHFKSLKKIKEASPEEIEEVVGKDKAATVINALRNQLEIK